MNMYSTDMYIIYNHTSSFMVYNIYVLFLCNRMIMDFTTTRFKVEKSSEMILLVCGQLW